MLDGFHPKVRALFFARERLNALMWAIALVGFPLYWAFLYVPEPAPIEVKLAPEIEDFAVEEDEQPVEEQPAPPPPPDAKLKIVDTPVKRPVTTTPDEVVTETPDESDEEKVIEVQRGAQAGGTGNGRAKDKPTEAKVAKPPPKPKAKPRLDPTKPVDRPENATPPTANRANVQPDYPADLRDQGITGRVVIKLHVHRDGTVRGAKVLSKTNNATSQSDRDRANKLFLAAVIKVVKTWSYSPATLNGTPISVWHTVTIPFSLTSG